MPDKEGDLIVGFLKCRNEIIREGNIYRCLHNLQEFCDEIFVACDASYDGTDEYVRKIIPEDHILQIKPEEQDFTKELEVKQKLLDMIHSAGPWKFIYWADTDEVLDADGTTNIRNYCRANLNTRTEGWMFHYAQLWVKSRWMRLDSDFNDGWFLKLWRYNPELCFNIIPGTHNSQFPGQLHAALQKGTVERADWEVLHYGNYGTNLRWKCVQYYGGLGGVDRHLIFPHATYKEIPLEKFPSGAEHSLEVGEEPKPYSDEHVELIRKLKDLKNLPKTFCVTISTYNRANYLPRTIDSVLKQTYQDFIVVVVDDGSTDNTKEVMREYQDKDPRVFYVQLLDHRGGVAVNEVACDIACNTCEYWVRLGSDDWMAENKLMLDFEAFEAGHDAIYGPFQAHDQSTGQYQEFGNTPFPIDKQQECFEREGFIASWADFAVKTKVLKIIKQKHGNYCDPNLKNMEDCLQNYRICKVTPWIWRGIYDGNLIINPDQNMMMEITQNWAKLTPTAFWNKDPKGSSANHEVYARDRMLTTQLINSEKNVSY